jgi:polysaccharide pyruvyl transferase WcaK-like protein
MSKISNAFFSVHTQFENIGDALINREMLRLISRDAVLHIDFSRCNTDFRKTLGLDKTTIEDKPFVAYHKTFLLFLSMIWCRICRQECYYFLNPGGYLGEYKGISLFKYINVFILFCFKVIGIRICHLGVSYERLGNKFAKLLKIRSSFLYKHYVRDSLSIDYARNLGIKIDGQMPDLAFNLFAHGYKKRATLKSVCFSFRSDQYSAQDQEIKELVTQVIKSFPVNTPYYLVAQVKRDIPIMQKLQTLVTDITHNPVELKMGYDDIDATLKFYENCDIVFSNRLHVLLMAASSSSHIVACIDEKHNQKITGIMSEIDLSRHKAVMWYKSI